MNTIADEKLTANSGNREIRGKITGRGHVITLYLKNKDDTFDRPSIWGRSRYQHRKLAEGGFFLQLERQVGKENASVLHNTGDDNDSAPAITLRDLKAIQDRITNGSLMRPEEEVDDLTHLEVHVCYKPRRIDSCSASGRRKRRETRDALSTIQRDITARRTGQQGEIANNVLHVGLERPPAYETPPPAYETPPPAYEEDEEVPPDYNAYLTSLRSSDHRLPPPVPQVE